MKKELSQYILSILIGTFLGYYVADYLNSLWWIGALIGGALGWATCGWQDFVAAVKVSYKETISWRPTKKFYRDLVTRLFICIHVVCLIVFLMIISGKIQTTGLMKHTDFEGVACMFGGVFTLYFLEPGKQSCPWFYTEDKYYYARFALGALLVNPFFVFITFACLVLSLWGIMVYQFCLNIKSLVSKREAIIEKIKSFFTLLITLVHSRMRFAAGISCVIGIMVGRIIGGEYSLVVGMSVGLIIGLLDYYIVAIRILKLKPVL